MKKSFSLIIVVLFFSLTAQAQFTQTSNGATNSYKIKLDGSIDPAPFEDQKPFQLNDGQLKQKHCSGAIADLNCYSGIIKQQAQEMNRRDQARAVRHAEINGSYRPLTNYYQGKQIVLDTSDQESCLEIRAQLLNYNLEAAQATESLFNLCEGDPKYPFDTVKTITIMGEVSEEYVRSYSLEKLTNTDRTLINETRNVLVAMGGMMGFMYTLPESVTKWGPDSEIKWHENVSRRPVIDKDDPAINYIGHPLSGAFYYTIARNLGYSKWQSFGYTVVMSTFFWEYGFEAMAERPSIQDLIVTPIIGSLIGEVFYEREQKIIANGGRVNGSRTLGKIALFILNPIGRISEQINKVLGRRMIQDSKLEFVTSRRKTYPILGDSPRDNYIGLRVRLIGNFF